jgi:hypothetical protein
MANNKQCRMPVIADAACGILILLFHQRNQKILEFHFVYSTIESSNKKAPSSIIYNITFVDKKLGIEKRRKLMVQT